MSSTYNQPLKRPTNLIEDVQIPRAAGGFDYRRNDVAFRPIGDLNSLYYRNLRPLLAGANNLAADYTVVPPLAVLNSSLATKQFSLDRLATPIKKVWFIGAGLLVVVYNRFSRFYRVSVRMITQPLTTFGVIYQLDDGSHRRLRAIDYRTAAAVLILAAAIVLAVISSLSKTPSHPLATQDNTQQSTLNIHPAVVTSSLMQGYIADSSSMSASTTKITSNAPVANYHLQFTKPEASTPVANTTPVSASTGSNSSSASGTTSTGGNSPSPTSPTTSGSTPVTVSTPVGGITVTTPITGNNTGSDDGGSNSTSGDTPSSGNDPTSGSGNSTGNSGDSGGLSVTTPLVGASVDTTPLTTNNSSL